MPFTPFHMGPGAMIKAIFGKYFSLMVFGFAQVTIDIEPLVRLLRGDNTVHGLSHTYLGAILIGMFSLVVGKIFCEKLLCAWNMITRFKYLLWLNLSPRISWFSATSGAFVGTFSHVFLDSLIHSDVYPFSPFSASNDLLYIMPTGWVYLLCLLLGIVGFMVITVVSLWNKWAIEIE
jgi:hypothetical protein